MKKRKKKSNKQSRREIIADVKRREVEWRKRKEKGKVAYMQIPYHIVGNIHIFLPITCIRHAVRYT